MAENTRDSVENVTPCTVDLNIVDGNLEGSSWTKSKGECSRDKVPNGHIPHSETKPTCENVDVIQSKLDIQENTNENVNKTDTALPESYSELITLNSDENECASNDTLNQSESIQSSQECNEDQKDIAALETSMKDCDISECTSDEKTKACPKDEENGIHYLVYESEEQMPNIMRLITKDLSEPYSIYTYRYFIHNWPKLCFLAMCGSSCVGAIVCKLDLHKKMVRRGYIAMLAVDQNYRRRGIGSHLVLKAIRAMVADDCDEVVLETEITNRAALHLYENLGFVRDKRLFRYYLNGVDALRLKLWLR